MRTPFDLHRDEKIAELARLARLAFLALENYLSSGYPHQREKCDDDTILYALNDLWMGLEDLAEGRDDEGQADEGAEAQS